MQPKEPLENCETQVVTYLDARVDCMIVRYNSDAVKQSIRKSSMINKGDFWKLLKRLSRKLHNVSRTALDQCRYEIRDPVSIWS